MEEEKGISLSDIFRVIKKNIILICIIVLAAILVGGVYTFGIAKEKYRAEATVLVAVKTQEDGQVDLNVSSKILGTVRELIKQDVVLEPVAKENNMSSSALGGMVNVVSVDYSFLLTIQVENNNGDLAVELANDIVRHLIEVSNTNESIASLVSNAITVTNNAETYKYAAPNKIMYMLIFTLLGGVVACVVVFVKEFASNKYTTKKDVEQDLKEKIVGVFYYEKRKNTKQDKNAHKNITLIEPTIKGFESYNRLLSNIKYANLDCPIKVVSSVSTGPNELKSTVTCNLAYCMAYNGKKVCIIDLDLRRPVVYKAFHVSREDGLVEYIDGEITKDKLIKHSEFGVDVITGGKHVVNPIAVIESSALAKLVSELREEYDYVVIDSAPLLACADSLSVAKLCDGVMFNVALKTSKKADIKEAIRSLHTVNTKKLGINLTKVPADKDSNYYYGE